MVLTGFVDVTLRDAEVEAVSLLENVLENPVEIETVELRNTLDVIWCIDVVTPYSRHASLKIANVVSISSSEQACCAQLSTDVMAGALLQRHLKSDSSQPFAFALSLMHFI